MLTRHQRWNSLPPIIKEAACLHAEVAGIVKPYLDGQYSRSRMLQDLACYLLGKKG